MRNELILWKTPITKGTAVGYSELAIGKDHIHLDIDRPHLPDLCGDSR